MYLSDIDLVCSVLLVGIMVVCRKFHGLNDFRNGLSFKTVMRILLFIILAVLKFIFVLILSLCSSEVKV